MRLLRKSAAGWKSGCLAGALACVLGMTGAGAAEPIAGHQTPVSDGAMELRRQADAERAVKQAEVAWKTGDFARACFFYQYALLRRPGDFVLFTRYADSLERAAKTELEAGRRDEAGAALDRLAAFLEEGTFAVPFDQLENVQARRERVEGMRRALYAEAATPAGVADAAAEVAAYASGQKKPVAPDLASAPEVLTAALEARGAIYQAAADAGHDLTTEPWATLGGQLRTIRAVLADREASEEFGRAWAAADAEESPEMAAYLLQGAEAALRRRVEAKADLPAACVEALAADLHRLRTKSVALARQAALSADEPAFTALREQVVLRLEELQGWAPPAFAWTQVRAASFIDEAKTKTTDTFVLEQELSRQLTPELKEKIEKFRAESKGRKEAELQDGYARLELELIDLAQAKRCQRQIDRIRETMELIRAQGVELAAPAHLAQVAVWMGTLDEHLKAAALVQYRLYNQWAVARVGSAWRRGVVSIGRVTDDKKGLAASLVDGMAMIDTQSLSPDALRVYQTIHEKLFSLMADAGKPDDDKEETSKLYVAMKFFDTPKTPLQNF